MLYQYFGDQLTRELATEAAMVAQGVETTGRDYLDTLNVSSRVTWVDKDGTVLYDNRADPAQMENHADRAEIRQAMLASQGTAQRESSTLSRRTYYAARRLSDGTVIRLASAQSTVVVLLASMIQPLLIILVLSMILASSAPFWTWTWKSRSSAGVMTSWPPLSPRSAVRTTPSAVRWTPCASSSGSLPP